MRTLIGCLINTIAVMLFITAVGPMPIFADGDTAAYKKAKKDAADAVAKAEALKKKCEELKAAAAAAQAAADAAKKKAADLRQAANDAANAAAMAGSAGSYPSAEASDAADKAAADAGRAADDARDKANKNPNDKEALKEARAKENEAIKKEKAADAAAGKLDTNSRAQRTAALRKAARAAERAARKAEREAAAAAAAAAAAQALVDAEHPCGKVDEAIAEADAAIAAFEKLLEKKITDSGESSKTHDDTKTVSGWKDRLHPRPPTVDPPKESGKTVEPPRPGIMAAPGADDVRVKTANGLQTVTFDTLQGTVTVNLPDGIRAGDTISGTVFTEPKGNNDEEKARNKTALNTTILDLAGMKIPAGGMFTWTTPGMPPGTPVPYQLRIVEINGNPTPVTQSGALITPDPPAAQSAAGMTVTNAQFNVPSLGQAGRPIVITGLFDGNSSNTSVTIQPAAPPSALAANLVILAESMRFLVFRSAANLTGSAQITINEGGNQASLPYRSVSVNLNAPKTNLLKDESTTLTVRLEGLAGITQNVLFRIEKIGVVTMQGGDVQVRSIKPKDVQADGSFTMTRTMTGRQSGAFSVVATVLASDRNIELRPR